MKNICILMCFICLPICVFGQNARYIQIQMLRAQVEQLEETRDEKRAELNKCVKTAKNFKIAAIATVSATGVGIAANIALHKKLASLGNTATPSGRGVTDTRSDVQKCLDEMSMYCTTGGADYDAETCQLYRDADCE